MNSSGAHSHPQQRNASKPACTLCARRKVKCDREEPSCKNCIKHNAECRYEESFPPQRHTKRRADAELRARINHLESLLQEKGVDPGSEASISPTQTSFHKTEERANAQKSFNRIMPERSMRPPSTSKNPLLHLDGPSCLKFMRRRYHAPSDPSLFSSSSLVAPVNILELHPEPRHMFRLWQIFAERINPMTKIIHAPSVQQRILDMVGWSMETCTPSFRALLFSIYLLAVVSLSASDCIQHFGEEKNTLMAKYQSSTWLSLIAANVFETRDLEVLQALVLFILSDPASDAATTLSAIAIRIGLKMGLNKECDSHKISLFEQEMRVRVWWQICTHDLLARHLFASRDVQDVLSLTPAIRLPLNVNDAELHPDMVKQPMEYPRATEMVYVLIKYEGALWGHRQRTQPRSNHEPANFDFDELENLLRDKYLQYCDTRIPLHAAAQTLFRASICVINYMRVRIKAERGMPADTIFDQAIEVLELDKANRDLPFATQLVWHGVPIHPDAIIQILSRLRQHGANGRTSRAWDLITQFWDEQLDGDWEEDETLFNNLLDLTLEAWDQSLRSPAGPYDSQSSNGRTSLCIARLQQIRHQRGIEDGSTQASTAESQYASLADSSLLSQEDFDFGGMEMPEDWMTFNNSLFYNYGYWTDFSMM